MSLKLNKATSKTDKNPHNCEESKPNLLKTGNKLPTSQIIAGLDVLWSQLVTGKDGFNHLATKVESLTAAAPEGIEQDKPATLLTRPTCSTSCSVDHVVPSNTLAPSSSPGPRWKGRESTFPFLPFPSKRIEIVTRIRVDRGTLVWTILIRQKRAGRQSPHPVRSSEHIASGVSSSQKAEAGGREEEVNRKTKKTQGTVPSLLDPLHSLSVTYNTWLPCFFL